MSKAQAPEEPETPKSGASLVDERAWAYDALAALSDGVIVVDHRGRLVYRNAAAERLAGVTSLPEDHEEWSSRYGIHAADEQTLFPSGSLPLLRALRGEIAPNVDLFVRNRAAPTGAHLRCSAMPLRDASGSLRGAVCIFRDITEQRRNQLKVREGERQRTAILDSIPEAAWLKDREGRFLAVNRRFIEATGKSSVDEVIGATDFDLWPEELAARYRADDLSVMHTGEPKRSEEPFVDGKGRRYWIETTKSRIVNDDGEVIGTTGIAHDVTDRRRAEEALRTSKDALERRVEERTQELAKVQESLVRKERLAVLGQLAGGVAHQIRNPLAAIMNATYVLKRHLSSAQHPNVEDALRIIHDEVRHANMIITGLLDHARVRAPVRDPASVVDLVERVLGADWIPANIRIERSIAEEIPLLDVDVDQLHGAIFNVVRNAVEAMPGGGVLSVELHVVHGAEIVIALSDTGPGISPQVAAHLFEPLHSTKPMGIGLGLVTARTFVEAHGGRIASVPTERGARFEIRLPIR